MSASHLIVAHVRLVCLNGWLIYLALAGGFGGANLLLQACFGDIAEMAPLLMYASYELR